MKTSQTLKIPLAALALLVASSAFAANKGSLHVSSPEDVAGKQLAAGDYSVRWEGPCVGRRTHHHARQERSGDSNR